MANSRRPRSAERPLESSRGTVPLAAERFFSDFFPGAALRGRRVAVGLSGGLDSVVLLDVLQQLAATQGFAIAAVHVNHGLSRNAPRWERFCRALCRARGVPLSVKRIRIESRRGLGLEAAARAGRRAALREARADAIALAHQMDDQAETVLLNLLRGAGVRGASAMPPSARLGEKLLIRPLLGVSRDAIRDYAKARGLPWVEDESNLDESFARNFIRTSVGPLLATRFPRWRESLARAARHFAAEALDERTLLRAFLEEHGLRSPSERKLIEMLRQLTTSAANAKVAIAHDGAVLRVWRGRPVVARDAAAVPFEPVVWRGEKRLRLPALGGALCFARKKGSGIDAALIDGKTLTVRTRAGGERLQLDARRPHRTLKNLFQEAGVPPWQRERLPLLFAGDALVWVAGLGVQAAFAAPATREGLVPQWRPERSAVRVA